MRFFPIIQFVDEIPQEVRDQLRNAHRYSNLGGTYDFVTKLSLIKRGTGQTRRLIFHELGHWAIAIFTKAHKIHTMYDNRHLPTEKPSKAGE